MPLQKEFQFIVNAMNFLPVTTCHSIHESIVPSVVTRNSTISILIKVVKTKVYKKNLNSPFINNFNPFFVKLILTSCRSSHDSSSPSSKCSPPTGTPSTFTRMEVHAGILSDLVWSCLFLNFHFFHVMIFNIICCMGVALPIWLTKIFLVKSH